MGELNLDTFGAMMDNLMKESEINMLITLPKGSLEPEVKTNFQTESGVVWFYLLLNAIRPVFERMREECGGFEDEEKMIDVLLKMVKDNILEAGGE